MLKQNVNLAILLTPHAASQMPQLQLIAFVNEIYQTTYEFLTFLSELSENCTRQNLARLTKTCCDQFYQLIRKMP